MHIYIERDEESQLRYTRSSFVSSDRNEHVQNVKSKELFTFEIPYNHLEVIHKGNTENHHKSEVVGGSKVQDQSSTHFKIKQ